MNILHVIDHMGIGGAQTILKGIFERDASRKDLFCYSLRIDKFENKIDHPNVRYYKGHSRFNVNSLFELREFVNDNNIEILHCHLLKSMIFGYLLKLLFFKNIKLIFHEHGRIFQDQSFYKSFIKLSKNTVDLHIAVSEATEKQLIDNAGIDKYRTKVLLNFVDIDYFSSQRTLSRKFEERKKIGLNENDFVLGYAGRHIKRKGCLDLIQAMEELKKFENIKLLMAGDGPEKEENIRLVKKLGLEKRIIFLGYISDIRWLYSAIDCFVIPSRWEPFGIVALEAYASGVPVIASNVVGLNEVVNDKKNGLLFEPQNMKDMSKKIELLYENSNLRNEIIKNGLETVKNYSLEKYLLNLNSIYRSLMEEK